MENQNDKQHQPQPPYQQNTQANPPVAPPGYNPSYPTQPPVMPPQYNQNPPMYYPPQPPMYPPPYNPYFKRKSGLATASLILGIISIVLTIYGFIPAILAIIFGIISNKQEYENKNFALIGLILGCVGIALSVIMVVFIAVLVAHVPSTPYHSGYNYGFISLFS